MTERLTAEDVARLRRLADKLADSAGVSALNRNLRHLFRYHTGHALDAQAIRALIAAVEEK